MENVLIFLANKRGISPPVVLSGGVRTPRTPPGGNPVYICQVSRQLIENQNYLLKLIKPKWLPQPRFQSHMKTDNTKRLADPENLYNTRFRENSEKKVLKKISHQVAAILIISGKLKF